MQPNIDILKINAVEADPEVAAGEKWHDQGRIDLRLSLVMRDKNTEYKLKTLFKFITSYTLSDETSSSLTA